MKTKNFASVVLPFCATVLFGASVCAQPYPSKPIRLVMGFPPGSSIDTDGRLLASKMSEALGQPIVSDNRVGAGGVIGASIVAKAPADGYTVFATPSTHVIAVYLSKNLPYDPIKDFTPIGAAIDTYQSLGGERRGTREFSSRASAVCQAQSRKAVVQQRGLGTQFHLAGEIFKAAAGVDILHVPYKSAVLALPDLVSGVISMTFSTVQAQLPLYRGGKVKIIGIMNPKRYPGLPDVPAIARSSSLATSTVRLDARLLRSGGHATTDRSAARCRNKGCPECTRRHAHVGGGGSDAYRGGSGGIRCNDKEEPGGNREASEGGRTQAGMTVSPFSWIRQPNLDEHCEGKMNEPSSRMVPVLEEVKQFISRDHKLWINGRWSDSASAKKLPIFDPSTGGKIGEICDASSEDVNRAVVAARAALEGEWHRCGRPTVKSA